MIGAFGMKPLFTDVKSYVGWRKSWRAVQKKMTRDIRRKKIEAKNLSRSSPGSDEARKAQSDLSHTQVMAFKLMSLRKDAKVRWQRILDMEKSIEEQNAGFPIKIEKCASVDFFFNKASLEFPVLPMWVVKTKGKTFYVNTVESEVGFDTKERPDHPSTKGLIRFRKASLVIDKDGNARLTRI